MQELTKHCPDHPNGRMAPMPSDPSRKRCVPPLVKVPDGSKDKTVQPKCKFTR